MDSKVTAVTQKWDITYTHATGEIAGEFLSALGEKKILGRRCPSCERVLVPARSFCDRCYTDTTDWVEVGQEGTIDVATVVYVQLLGLPKPPYAVAYVRMDKADTAIMGLVKGLEMSNPEEAAEKLKIGTRVKVQFKDVPEGRISDLWFVLA